MSKEKMETKTNVNRAKLYQLVLFPMNNGATNVYYILTMNFIAYYANGVLGLFLMFATTMVTVMRLFDAVTDPIIGALIDRTSTKFGKFRPYMALGNVIMIVSSVLLYFGTRVISENMSWLKYVCFVLFYALYVIGYTFQTACTRSGQTCLTNDPNQRPLFTVFNTVASLIGMGLVQFLAPILSEKLGGYNSAAFFNVMIPLAVLVSAALTILAVIGIWEKDRPEFFGVGGTQEKVELKEYVAILKANKELQRLMVAGAGCKLAFSIATNMTVLCMLYGAMMGNYGGLYLPMMIVGVCGIRGWRLECTWVYSYYCFCGDRKIRRFNCVCCRQIFIPYFLFCFLVLDTGLIMQRQICRFQWWQIVQIMKLIVPGGISPALWERCFRLLINW